ncbi:MAG: heme exporter protein CcmD [Kordiimonadaceae bacterium]|jgi:heme exporter protein CcmD|nr:heme exporter protein CcmD [Kordiimonadaceae bacterium]MBT6036549.1 heme exporter protein CcmD [Kordiimonadaceae bacterium]MBT6329857.1 heme exporter protein CcmD [Kordiimonadaceae bacterium]MBT7582512.1 heme exporter protein CcmD [Kordiimonadaceae bacterium]
MGEYGIFVWPCYGAVVVLLTALCYLSWKNKRDDEKELSILQKQYEELQNKSNKT